MATTSDTTLFSGALQVLNSLGAGTKGGGAAGFFSPSNPVMQILMYNVIGQALQPLLAPFTQVESNFMNARLSVVPISPADAALAKLRGDIDQDTAESEAQMSGINSTRFGWLQGNTGEPPAIEQALLLWRRKQISDTDMGTIVKQSRIRDEWQQAILDLQYAPMSAADAVAAAVQNQLGYDRASNTGPALDAAKIAGLDPADFPVLYDTHGRPPGVEQVMELVRRGIVPASGTGPDMLSLEQAVDESDIKDKWFPAYQALLTYLPPPRTVTAMLRAGALTQQQALTYLQDAGLSAELAAAYVTEATTTKVAGAKSLAEGSVLSLYAEKLIPESEAVTMLGQLGYNAQEAGFLLQLQDLKESQRVLNSATTKIGGLFLAHKLTTTQASSALDTLGVPPAQRDQLLTTWTLELGASVRVLSEATVAAAWHYGAISDDMAMGYLQALGYSAFDSWVYLAAHNSGTGPKQVPPVDTTAPLPF